MSKTIWGIWRLLAQLVDLPRLFKLYWSVEKLGCYYRLRPDPLWESSITEWLSFCGQEGGHGGVIVAAKDTLIGTEIPTRTNTEFAAASFDCHVQSTPMVPSIAPSSDQAYTEELCDKIRELHIQNQRATICIAGDVNLPDIEWKTNYISGHSPYEQVSFKHSFRHRFGAVS